MLTSVAFAALPGSNLITSPGAITTPVIVDALEPIQTIKPVSVITIPYKSRHETIEAVPLYRAYDTEWDRHYYSNNYDSHQTMLSYPGMVDDGKAGYISSVPLPYTVPLWHMVRGVRRNTSPPPKPTATISPNNTPTKITASWAM